VPPWYEGLMLKDDRFVVKSGVMPAEQRLLNAIVGQAAGFTVLKSNNVPNTAGAKYKIVAGHPMAWSFAEQASQVEAYRPESRFADAVKGLHLYGASEGYSPERVGCANRQPSFVGQWHKKGE